MSRYEKLEDRDWARDAVSQRLIDAERRVDMRVPEHIVERALERTQSAFGLAARRRGPLGICSSWMALLAIGGLLAASVTWFRSSRSIPSSSLSASSPLVTSESKASTPKTHETTTFAATEAAVPREKLAVDVEALPSAVVAKAKSPPTPARDERVDAEASRLAEERALIVRIRDALRRREYSEASRLIASHESEYPRGQFVEQREALHVWLIRDQGMNDQADREADEFKTEHPKSLMAPSIGAPK